MVGSQKVVPDLGTTLRRIETYSYPLEDARLQEAYGVRADGCSEVGDLAAVAAARTAGQTADQPALVIAPR